MSQKALSDIRVQLAQLTDIELQQVILLATTMRTRADKDQQVMVWYNALSQALITRIEWRTPPFNALPDHTKTQINKTYFSLLEWFDEVFVPKLTRIEQSWAFQWSAQLLADSLLDRDRPLCLNGLLNAVTEIPWVIDQQFPGYTKSKLLRWVIKKGFDHDNRS